MEIRTREYLYGPDRIVASGKANHIGEFDIKIPKLRVDQIVVVVLKNSEGKEIEQVIKTVIDNAPSTPPLPIMMILESLTMRKKYGRLPLIWL